MAPPLVKKWLDTTLIGRALFPINATIFFFQIVVPLAWYARLTEFVLALHFSTTPHVCGPIYALKAQVSGGIGFP